MRGRLRTFPAPDEDTEFSFLHGSCNLSIVSLTNVGALAAGALGTIGAAGSFERPGPHPHAWVMTLAKAAGNVFMGARLAVDVLRARLGGPKPREFSSVDEEKLMLFLFSIVYGMTGFKQPKPILPSPFAPLKKLLDGECPPSFMIHAGDQIYYDFPFSERKPDDFENFLDDDWGVLRDSRRLLSEFGWYRGSFFHDWIGEKVNRKLGSADATFAQLKEAGRPDLYVYGTNLSTRFGEVFSAERTPSERIADADRPRVARKTDYYDRENRRFLRKHPGRSRYCYNRETLGFRLDSEREIAAFRYGAEPQHQRIDDFFDYAWGLVKAMMESQANQHLHSDDWQRTVYIDTKGVSTTDFDLSARKKQVLQDSGRKGTEEYFAWYDDPKSQPANRPEP